MKDQHPQIVEAEKRLEAAKETYVRACVSIDHQYLKPLVGSAPDRITDVNRIRKAFSDVAVDIAPAAPLEQPGGAARGRTTTKGRK